MSNKIKIIGFTLVAVLALAIFGAGVAFAQTPTPATGFGPGWMMGGSDQTGYGPGRMGGRGGMMGGFAQNGEGADWMNAMHQWMTNSGGMHTFVWNALAEKLGLTSDELTAELTSGKTIAQVAEDQGISREDLVATLETAHAEGLAQAVADGALTQEQADSMSARMAGRYEQMLDQTGAGMLGGRGGRMGGSGGCHANWNSAPADQQPQP